MKGKKSLHRDGLCPAVGWMDGGLTAGGLAALAVLDFALGLWWQGAMLAVLTAGAVECLLRERRRKERSV